MARSSVTLPSSMARPPGLEDFDQEEAGNKSSNVGEKGHIGMGRSGKAQELKEKPKAQDHHRRYIDEPYNNKNEKEGKNASAGKQEEIGPQDPADRPAGPDHGRGGSRIGEDLHQGGEKAGNEIEEEKPKMTEGVLDVISEYPKVKHVSQKVHEAAMEEHGGENRQGDGDGGDDMDDFPMDNLVRDGSPLKNQVLILDGTQGELVEEDRPIGQDEKDGHNGESISGVVVF